MSDYGIAGLRDSDGERKPVEHTTDWNGDEVTVKFVPPTITEVDDLEELLNQEDLTPKEIQGPLNEYLVEPSIPDDQEWTLPEFNCYIGAIYEWSMGDGDGAAGAVADELEERDGDEGN